MVELIEGLIILTAFLSVIIFFFIKWRKDYKRTGKLFAPNDNTKMETKNRIKLIFKIILFLGIVLTMVVFWHDQYNYHFGKYPEHTINCLENSNIAVIKIQGEIVTYGTELADSENPETTTEDMISSETILDYLNQIEKNNDIEAIIVEIDSFGGSPVASEEIMNALKKSSKPIATVVREVALSGGYLIATATDRIFASELSDIGAIGVTMSYLDYSQKNKEEGIIYQQLSSGKFKDTGDPDKALSAEEKELLMRDTNLMHEIFIRNVATNRNLDIEKVRELADGSSMLGMAAKENGLIDEIGDINDAKEWLENQLGI